MTFKALLPGLSVVVASLLWATDATVRGQAFGSGAARTVAMIEHLIAFIVIFPLVFHSGQGRVLLNSRADWMKMLLMAIGGSALAGTVYTQGVDHLGASMAAVFTFIQPLFVLGFAYLFLKERSSSTFYFAALWVVANSVILSFPFYDLETLGDASSSVGSGVLLVTLAAIIWSASAVAGKSLVMKYNIIAILAWRFGFAALFLYLSLVVIPEPVNLPALLAEQGLLSALYLGIVINAVGFAFYYYGLKRLPIRVVAFIELLYPLFGILIPMWSRGGSVGVLHVFGSVTLLLSIGLLLHLEYPRPRKAG